MTLVVEERIQCYTDLHLLNIVFSFELVTKIFKLRQVWHKAQPQHLCTMTGDKIRHKCYLKFGTKTHSETWSFSCPFQKPVTCRPLACNWFNLLKPTGHVMHQQFNIQQLYALPTLYLCVLYLSENKQRLVPLTA